MSKKKRRAPPKPARSAPQAPPEPQKPARPRRPRAWRPWIAAALAAAGLGALAWGAVRSATTARTRLPPEVAVRRDTVKYADFVGSEACAECHKWQYEAWARSTHGRAGGPPYPEVVIAPFDGRPMRFSDAVVTPTVNPRGEYVFVVEQYERPTVEFRVAGVVGGGHMEGGGTQGFLGAFPDGTVRFLPFDWSRHDRVWFCNTNGRTERGFIPITPDLPIAECGDWPPNRVFGSSLRFQNCGQCHGSQIRLAFDAAAHLWRTQFTTLQVNCESCHGPGRRHIRLARRGFARGSRDIGYAALQALDKDSSLMVCFRCHTLKQELRLGFLPGDVLEDFYALRMHVLEGDPFYSDGRVRHFAYQESHLYSDCYLNGSMTCTDCHDPHSQKYRDIDGARLPGRFDDRQCTDCHASLAERPELHTHHRADSTGGRCVACHMPYLQEHRMGSVIRYARSDHSIPIPRPAFDTQLGIEDACSPCHHDRSVAQLEADTRKWWGDLKPHNPAVAALMRADSTPNRVAAARLLLTIGERHRAAQVVGLARFITRFLTPDMSDLEPQTLVPLEQLGLNRDPDIAALALAGVHLAAGNSGEVRRYLVGRVSALGRRDALIRDRWVWVLLSLGNAYGQRGDLGKALATFRKAEELRPNAPEVLAAIGLALTGTGDDPGALRYLRRSIAADPSQPVTIGNLALVLQRQGRWDEALATYERSLALDPYEPVTYVNLGNALARQKQYREAVDAWERAVALDPRLVAADLGLAQVYERLGERDRAIAAARRAVEFEPRNAMARQMLERLQGTPRR